MKLNITQELLDCLIAVDPGDDDSLHCFVESIEDGFTRGYFIRELECLHYSMDDKEAKDRLINVFREVL